jgi:hypothetical protein
MSARSIVAGIPSSAICVGIAFTVCVCAAPAALAQGSDPVDADRVTVRFTGDQFELVGVNAVSSVLPPADELPGDLGSVSGFWFELQAAGGEARYRRIIGDPVRLVFEGPDVVQDGSRSAPNEIRLMSMRSSEAERAVNNGLVAVPKRSNFKRSATTTRLKTMGIPERVEAIPEERVFSVLVPRAAAGDELVLYGAPLSVGNQAEPAAELARIPLATTRAKEVRDE